MATNDEFEHDAVMQRLNFLLQRARLVKPSTSIDPPLQVAELVPEDQALLGDIEGEREVRWLAVDSAARRLFYANLGAIRIHQPDFVTIWNLLDILQYCGDRGMKTILTTVGSRD